MSAEDAAKYAAAAAALGLGLYTYIQAKDEADESNNTPRGITKVEYSSSSSQNVVKITFTPSIRILMADDLTFRETKTTPPMDGPAVPKKIFSNNQIEVDFGSTNIVSLQPGGFIDVKTTPANQAAADVGDAGEALGSGLGSGLGGLFSGLFEGLGLGFGDALQGLKTVCLILFAVLLLGGCVYLIYKMLASSNKNE